MKFSLLLATKMILRQKSISLLTLVCFVGGCLLLFVAASYGEAFLAEVSCFDVKHSNTSIYTTIHTQQHETGQTITSADVKAFLRSYPFVDDVCLTTNIHQTNAIGASMYFSLMDNGFEDTFRFNLVEGRLFTPLELEEGSNVCILEDDRQHASGLGVGDFLFLEGTGYQIVGIIRTVAFANRIFLPSALEPRFADAISGFTVVAQVSDLTNADLINWPLLTRGYVDAGTAQEYYRQSARQLIQLFSLVFSVGLAVFIYSLLNIYNIILARIIARGKSIGIQMAIGASPRNVFAQFYIETFIIMIMANIIIFLLEPIISVLLKATLNHLFGPITLVIMLVNAIITTFGVTFLLFRRTNVFTIPQLVGGKLT
jgi:ABC-type antimicrobial peptide transport system, permease component